MTSMIRIFNQSFGNAVKLCPIFVIYWSFPKQVTSITQVKWKKQVDSWLGQTQTKFRFEVWLVFDVWYKFDVEIKIQTSFVKV